MSDSLSFVKTSHHLSLHSPSTILVTDTACPSPDQPTTQRRTAVKRPAQATMLVEILRDQWTNAQIVPVARKYWSVEAGQEFVMQLMVDVSA